MRALLAGGNAVKLPPHGEALAERLKFGNPPLHAVVCIGLGSWQRAKRWNESPADTAAMVLPPDTLPESLQWPVDNIPVVIDADTGPSIDLIHNLAHRLLVCGSHPFTRFVWSPKS